MSEKVKRRPGLAGHGPRYVRINPKCVRYRLDDLADFQDKHLVEVASWIAS